jgi:hypothetical protein
MNLFKKIATAVTNFFTAPKPKPAAAEPRKTHSVALPQRNDAPRRLTVADALAIAYGRNRRPKSIQRSLRRGAKWLRNPNNAQYLRHS